MKRFKLALVTGATSGIGEELAYLLAEEGIGLIIHGRNVLELERLVAMLRVKVPVLTIMADLSTAEGQEAVVNCVNEHVPDLVINNAGFGLYGNALDFSTGEQMAILAVNAEAVVRISLEAAKTLKRYGRQGVIMNISSVAAFSIAPRLCLYAGAKALVNQFTESLDVEIKPFGIRALVACPGVVRTHFRERAAGAKKSLKDESFLSMSSKFAAKQIWQQIERGEGFKIFHWPYRVILFLVRFILPKSLVARIMDRAVRNLEVK